MTRTPVASSQLSSVGYDQDTRKLEIQFKNGSIYEYDDVPPETHKELMSSRSTGEYFNKNIKWNFVYRKL